MIDVSFVKMAAWIQDPPRKLSVKERMARLSFEHVKTGAAQVWDVSLSYLFQDHVILRCQSKKDLNGYHWNK